MPGQRKLWLIWMKCINQIIVLDHSWSLIYRLIEFVLPWNGNFNDSNIKARYNSYKANAKPQYH